MSDPAPRGLSPSSFNQLNECMRKYGYRKVAKLAPDDDIAVDVEALEFGKFLHRILELCRHDVSGVTHADVQELKNKEFLSLDDDYHVALALAGAMAYKKIHVASGLEVVACEEVIDNAEFFGVVDAVMKDARGYFYVVDLKTAATFNQQLLTTLPRNVQMNLYAAQAPYLAAKLGLDPDKFLGIRYRCVTKSKAQRKMSESMSAYVHRLAGVVRAYDITIDVAVMDPRGALKRHKSLYDFVSKETDIEKYPQNFNACNSYYRICEFYSQCYGRKSTDAPAVKVVTSDD